VGWRGTNLRNTKGQKPVVVEKNKRPGQSPERGKKKGTKKDLFSPNKKRARACRPWKTQRDLQLEPREGQGGGGDNRGGLCACETGSKNV